MLARLFCWIFGHHYEVHQQFSADSRRVVCRHCLGDWAMNDRVRAFVPWDTEFHQFYTYCGHRINDPWEGK